MGSLTSKPKAPPEPQVVFVPQPTTTSIATPSDPAKSPEPDAGQTRTQNLLRRNRGRLGTIATSFRGLLSLADPSASRKSLLGE